MQSVRGTISTVESSSRDCSSSTAARRYLDFDKELPISMVTARVVISETFSDSICSAMRTAGSWSWSVGADRATAYEVSKKTILFMARRLIAVEVIVQARRPVRGALQFEGAGRLKERFRFRAGPLRRLDGDTDARVRLKLKRLVGPQHLAVVNGLKRLRHLRPPSPLGYSRLSPSA